MKLKCPICFSPLDDHFQCENAHTFQVEDGVLKLMQPTYQKRIDDWLVDFEDFRAANLFKYNFDDLPESGVAFLGKIWQARTRDLKIIKHYMSPRTKSVLDVGSWNGWLANRMSKLGAEVTAIDYFMHELDGLKAKKHYANPAWNAIQMDLENMQVLDDQFDLIVLNRCYAYFADVKKVLEDLSSLLTDSGILIITGLNVVAQGEGVSNELVEARQEFRNKYGRELEFKKFKGYVDRNDLEFLKKLGYSIYYYPNLKNQISRLLSNKATSYYSIYRQSEGKDYADET